MVYAPTILYKKKSKTNMKKYISISLLIFVYHSGIAQKSNDEYNTALYIGQVKESFESPIFSNKYATYSEVDSINQENCIPNTCMIRDLWFNFSVTDDAKYNVSVVPVDFQGINRLQFPALIIYETKTFGELDVVACNTGNRQLAQCEATYLATGNYTLRVSDMSKYGEDNSGAFKIVIERISAYKLTDKEKTYSERIGMLYDSGGENANYNNIQSQKATMCLPNANDKIELVLDWYHINETGDNIKVFDGIDVTAPLINSVGIQQSHNSSSGRNIISKASGNCVTLQFNVDNKEKREGFKAKWRKTEAKALGNTYYKLNPNTRDLDYFFLYKIAPYNIKCLPKNIAIFKTTSDSGFPISEGIVLSVNPIENLWKSSSNMIKNEDIVIDSFIRDSTVGKLVELQNTCSFEFYQENTNPKTKFEYVLGSNQFYLPNTGTESDVVALILQENPNYPTAGLKNLLPNKKKQAQIRNIKGNNWQYVENNNYGDIKLNNFTVDTINTHKPLSYIKKKYKVCDESMVYTLGIGTQRLDSPNTALFFGVPDNEHPRMELKSQTIDYLFEKSCNNNKDSIIITLAKVSNTSLSYTWRFINPFTGADPMGDIVFNAPKKIIFKPGVTRLAFAINATDDGISEMDEIVYFDLLDYDFGNKNVCTYGPRTQIRFTIRDNASLKMTDIFGTKDTIKTCYGSNLPIKLIAYGGDNFNWTPKALFQNPNDKEQILTVNKSQWVYVTSKSGTCNLKDSIYLQVIKPTEGFVVDKKIICKGDSVKLSLPNQDGFYWSMNGSKYVKSKTKAIIAPKTTSVILFKAFDGACASLDSVKIEVDESVFSPIANDTTICIGQTVALNKINTSLNKYEWTPTTNLDASKIVNPVAKPTSDISYVANMISPKGVCTHKDTINIKVVSAKLSLSVTPDTVVVKGTPIKVTANTNGSGTYKWMPALSTSSVLEDMLKENQKIYKVTFNNGACIISDSILIRTINEQIPLAFTPNGDGINDYFNFVSNTELKVNDFKVYNRWGTTVYSNQNPNLGWDGTFQGESQPSDVYLYRIEYVLGNKVNIIQGDVTLLR
jgi:gliding motility-associated-like protein